MVVIYFHCQCFLTFLQLISSNEELKKELESEKGKAVPASEVPHEQIENVDEIRRLQAENTALQKNLIGLFCIHNLLLHLFVKLFLAFSFTTHQILIYCWSQNSF